MALRALFQVRELLDDGYDVRAPGQALSRTGKDFPFPAVQGMEVVCRYIVQTPPGGYRVMQSITSRGCVSRNNVLMRLGAVFFVATGLFFGALLAALAGVSG